MTLPRIRVATPEDIESVCAIRQHPAVVPHQYHDPDPKQRYELIIGDSSNPESQVKMDVVEVDGSVVGFVIHGYADVDEIRIALLGWNLHPDNWGQGIMNNALTQTFGHLFDQKNRTHVVAHCFSSNIRCIKLLKRLGLQRWRYPISSRVSTMLVERSLKWELKFGITSDQWKILSSKNA